MASANAVTYRIRDWEENFEKSKTKKIQAELRWVGLPVKHDGGGYRRIIRRKDGPQIYAAWVLMLQVAAKCPVRGVLHDGFAPLDGDDLEIKTDCPARWFDLALEVLVDPKIGWIEAGSFEAGAFCPIKTPLTPTREPVDDNETFVDHNEGTRTPPTRAPTRQDITIQDRTISILPTGVGDGETDLPQSASNAEADKPLTKREKILAIYDAYPRKVGKKKALAAIERALAKVPFEKLLEAVQDFARRTQGADKQYVIYPEGWFNQGRWEDDRAEWNRIGRDDSGKPPRPDPGTNYDPDHQTDLNW